MFGRRLIGSRVKATTPNTTSATAHMVTVTRRLRENSMRLMPETLPLPGGRSAADGTRLGEAEIRGLRRGDDLHRRARLQPALPGHDHLLARRHAGERLDPAPFLQAERHFSLLGHVAPHHEDVAVLQLADDRLTRQKDGARMDLAHDIDGHEGTGPH